MAAGRPTKYNAKLNKQAEKLAMLGATDKQLAAFFEVCEDTIHEWKKAHSEFSESLKRGKEIADANVAYSLYKRATGYCHPDIDIKVIKDKIVITPLKKHYPPDTIAAIFWLKNRQKEIWRDKQTFEFENLTDDQLQKLVNELTQKVKAASNE